MKHGEGKFPFFIILEVNMKKIIGILALLSVLLMQGAMAWDWNTLAGSVHNAKQDVTGLFVEKEERTFFRCLAWNLKTKTAKNTTTATS